MKIGLFGDGKKELKRITVMLYQSMRKIPNLVELGKYCDLIIVDECHLAIDAIEEILKNFHSTWYRYGLTATPISSARKSKWFHLTSQLGEKIITVTDKQAKKRVAPVNAYMFKFYCEPENIDYDLYRENVLLNEERCIFLLKMVRWAFNKKNTQSCLLLVDEYEQAKMLKRLSRKFLDTKPEIAWSKLKREDLEDIKERLNNRKLKFCIATPVFSTGTNIPNVDCVVLGSARKSITNTKQKIGRGRRKTEIKDELLLLDIYEQIGKHDKYFIKYSERRKNIYSRKKWLKEIYEGSELN